MEALNANLFKFKIPSEKEESESGSDYSEGEFANILADLPTEVVHRVHALENLHDKRAEIELEFKKELALLEKKYEDMYAPLYADRARIINGEREVAEEEYAGREESGVALVEESASASSVKGIPDFWLNVLKRSHLANLVCEDDEAALKCLRDIKSERIIDESAPKLVVSFDFAPNDYFTNQVLSMTVMFNSEGNGVVGFETTPVEWKEGKNLCWKTAVRRMRHRGKPGIFINKESKEELNSFFHLFDEIKGDCDHDHDEDGEEHEQGHDDQESKFMANAEICSFLDRYIVSGAIEWYMGRGSDDGEEDYEDEDYEDDYGSEDDQ